MPKKTISRKFFIILAAGIIAFLLSVCRGSRAEASDLAIPTFNPNASFDDLPPIATPIPPYTKPPSDQRGPVDDLPTDDPSPTPDPFNVTFTPSPAGSVNFSYTSIRSNNYVSRIVNGVRRYYRGLTGKFDTVPPTQGGSNIKSDAYGWYTPTNLFSQNCRLYSADDYLYLGMFFTGVSGIPLGSTLTLGGIWTSLFPVKMLPTEGLEYAMEPQVNFHFTLKYASGVYQFYDLVCSVEDIQKGISYPIEVVDNISEISIEIIFSNTLAPDDNLSGGNVPVIYFASDNVDNYYSISAFVSLPPASQETNAINNQTSIIGRLISTAVNFLFDSIRSLFLPDSQQLVAWMQAHSSTDDSNNALSLVKVYFVRLLGTFGAVSEPSPPVLNIPALRFNVSGQTVEPFSGYTFDFSTLPQEIFQYSRMVGDIFLIGAFVRYIWTLFTRFFDLYYSRGTSKSDGGGDNE